MRSDNPVDFDPLDPPGPYTARRIQESVRRCCMIGRTVDTSAIRLIAGADAAYSNDMTYAAAVVMKFPEAEFVEVARSVRPTKFPYIPGLLSFREGPAIIESVRTLSVIPDVLMVNGHGYAHPRRAGLACHVGVVLDIPTVGIARNLLTGTAVSPGPRKGDRAPIMDADEVVGMAVRTKERAKQVYVSAGHKVDLGQAVEIVMETVTTSLFPEPLHIADRISRASRKSGNAGTFQ